MLKGFSRPFSGEASKIQQDVFMLFGGVLRRLDKVNLP
jgi:hypothetical protein